MRVRRQVNRSILFKIATMMRVRQVNRSILFLLSFMIIRQAILLTNTMKSNVHVEETTRNNDNDTKKVTEKIQQDHHPNQTLQQAAPLFNNLRAIIVGLEHSGTTIMGNLIMNAPCVIGALETGYLLAETPSEIESIHPWFEWNSAKYSDDFWYMLQPDDIALMKNAPNFVEMYDILRQKSHLFNNLVDEEYCPRPYQMVDKTPRYVYPEYFEKIVAKTPHVPVIVLKKPFEKLQQSWAARNSTLTKTFYDEVYRNVEIVKQKYPKRIFMVHYEDLMGDPDSIMTDVYKFLGLKWDHEYLSMAGWKKKFQHYPKKLAQIQKLEFETGKHSPSFFMNKTETSNE